MRNGIVRIARYDGRSLRWRPQIRIAMGVCMHERAADLADLQALLDRSVAGAGPHLSSIFSEERRLSATELSERLTGMRLLTLATVTAAGEPRTAPVDGLFFRGQFWFGSAANSARFRHIRVRPAVSATHLPGESLAVIVHGRCDLIDINDEQDEAITGFRATCVEIYGPGWTEWGPPAQYARIAADRMFSFAMPQEEIDTQKAGRSA